MSANIFRVFTHIGAVQDPIMIAFEIDNFFNLVNSLLECPHNFFHYGEFAAKFLELLDFSVCHCCEFCLRRGRSIIFHFLIKEKNDFF